MAESGKEFQQNDDESLDGDVLYGGTNINSFGDYSGIVKKHKLWKN